MKRVIMASVVMATVLTVAFAIRANRANAIVVIPQCGCPPCFYCGWCR